MRILAGQYKGRKLLAPTGRATRPITAAVKKSLFGMLGGHVIDATVVDLYCGTGTLGLEALSRGARCCCFADRDRVVVAKLRRNIATLAVDDRSTVWPGDISVRLTRWLAELGEPVDLVFVDPPYALVREWDWSRAVVTIFSPLADRLSADGILVFRLGGKVDLPERLGALEILRLRRYGDMTLALLGLP